MKRFLALFLMLALLLATLAGCGDPVEITLGEASNSTQNGASGTAGGNASGGTASGGESGDAAADGTEQGGEGSQAEASQVVDNRTIEEKYAEADAAYKDVKGWINIPNTYVDYAIVQSSDNTYYLDKNLAGSYYWYGSVFADCDNHMETASGLDQNTVLFGHNKADGVLFGNLTKYEDANWAKNHAYITTIVGGEKLTWLVVAAIDCETSFRYISTSLSDSTLQSFMDRSYIDVDHSVSSSDKFLTLSTCTYKYKYASGQSRTDVRFVVLAVQVDSSSSTPSITANSDRVAPTFESK